ncbi:MAG TPA: single-stranded DNA-binding protein [Bacteroidia bacterium]|jgi:single-strand DNA-binding protein|nr:single-stranded DNA-binding protein [Bacteroidia bacterium]
MAGINKVILVGNLGKDPEMRKLEGGVTRVNFSLATTEYYKDKEGRRIEQTEWHNIVLWRSVAENAERLLKKGNTIYLEGKIQTRKWQDKDGVQRSITEIVGETFQLIKRQDPNAQTDTNTPSGPTGGDDLPF